MTSPMLERSCDFDDLRAAHRRERAPAQFRQRMWERFETAASRESARPALSMKSLLPSSSLGGFCAVAALGALLIWCIGHVQQDELEDEVSGPLGALSAPTRESSPGGNRSKSGRLCPTSEIPAGAFIYPAEREMDRWPAPLLVRTFQAQTPSCGALERRYLEVIPTSLSPQTSAPILIALHDQGQNVASLRIQETRWYFDALALRESFILVYANAAPSAATAPGLDNSGGWQTRAGAHPEIDDEAYLAGIVQDLTARGVVSGNNDVLLLGFGEGATMALAAAAKRPDRYAAVAAFMPSRVAVPAPGVASSRLSRVLLVTREPVTGEGQQNELEVAAEQWAVAIGALPAALGARPEARLRAVSGLQQLDLSAGGAGPSVRILVADRDLFPPPGAADQLSLDASRRRPGFVDGAEQVWAFSRKQPARG